jgi:alpha/beta superfamily hydrolase
MRPFYFGAPGRRLFGVHLAPQEARRDCAVVLCYPMGQEYINSHRAFRHLARLLADEGFHVLRFDYFGCGDSEGECKQGTMSQWLSDVSTAILEVRNRSRVGAICLVGLRLGASLSLLAGMRRPSGEKPTSTNCKHSTGNSCPRFQVSASESVLSSTATSYLALRCPTISGASLSRRICWLPQAHPQNKCFSFSRPSRGMTGISAHN